VPARIARIIRMRKTHREGPEPLARNPTVLADELIECSV